MNTRAQAAKIIAILLQDKISLTELLNRNELNQFAKRDVAFIKELCFGVVRWYHQLTAILQLLLEKPLKEKEFDIHCLLLIGLYQLHILKIKSYAAVNETVDAAKDLKKTWATKLINAVLRHSERKQKEIQEKINSLPDAYFSHPEWMVKLIREAWPSQWKKILTVNNHYPPMSLRVNLQKMDPERYLKLLSKRNILATLSNVASSGIILEEAISIEHLTGFAEGLISVQDCAAQLAAPLLELVPGLRVLDTCAAPGGKTTHLLELQPHLAEVVAIDHDEKRLTRIHENLNRLNLTATVKCADITENTWWDKKLFDRILLDAPCSATGVIRRHPDIKILRKKSDIEKLATQQFLILENLWPMLKVGGILLYVTCSILPEENSEIIEKFLKQHADAKEIPIAFDVGIMTQPGCQILPGDHGMDGFYYAKLVKSHACHPEG